jgi:hypothetical protein
MPGRRLAELAPVGLGHRRASSTAVAPSDENPGRASREISQNGGPFLSGLLDRSSRADPAADPETRDALLAAGDNVSFILAMSGEARCQPRAQASHDPKSLMKQALGSFPRIENANGRLDAVLADDQTASAAGEASRTAPPSASAP